jgi:hypothetical protein
MRKLIHSEEQAIENILRFQEYAPELADRMPYGRAWYAVERNGGWLFAPSKFVGYEGLTGEAYLNLSMTNLDGRQTEGVLQEWFMRVPPDDLLILTVLAEIKKFFAQYGKRPNHKLRILVSKSLFAKEKDDSQLPRLLAIVYRRLPEDEQRIFQDLISA